ncbi:MAG: hypothetical protein JSW66_11495 [Phycisphaerales bacterium]|nr:MAG: hypothetical protein JSW66_11495 [Phycisphaerales bacterium]
MIDSKTNVEAGPSVIAIVQEDDKLKGVEIRSANGSFDLLWTRSSEDLDWARFANECGISVEPNAFPEEADSERMVVVGYSSAGAIFHRTTVPAVGQREIASIVQLQAETRLPLPADQIELAWRADPERDGQIGVTMAVARRENLRKFTATVQFLQPAQVLLDGEGVVQAWKTVFGGAERKAVVLSMGRRSTHVCLVEDGRLSNAVVLDAGIADLVAEDGTEQTEATEMFTQDMRGVLELFDCAGQPDLPVFVLSDGSAGHVSTVSALRLVGLNARVALPHVHKSESEGGLGAEGLYDYRVPIGLALLALQEDDDALNLFERLYSLEAKDQQGHWLHSPKAAAAIATVMLVLLAVVWFAVDVASPGAIETRLEASISDVDMDQLLEKNRLIRAAARQRPDMLDILKLVNESGGRGITLNNMLFKQGQPISVSGQAKSNDDLSRFEKSLQANKSIGEVNPPTASMDSKSRKITFTITFHYKSFTKKTTRSRS